MTSKSMTRRNRHAVIAAATAIVVLSSSAGPAFADSGLEADATANVVAAAAPVSLQPVGLEEADGEYQASFDNGASLGLPSSPSGELSLIATDGATATVTLPGSDGLRDGVIASDGTVNYLGNESTPSVNVLPSDDGVRVSTVIDSAAQTEQFSYDFGAGSTVEVQSDGSALVYRETKGVTSDGAVLEEVIATVRPAWAFDANGTPVDTEYVGSGSTLTQLVDHAESDVAYPVVADPTFDVPLIFQNRVRFNRAETKSIKELGLGALGGAVCGPMAWVCIGAAGILAYNATVADNSKPKACVQVTLTQSPLNPAPIWWVDQYRGGPCK